MATMSVPSQRLSWLRSKNLLFAFIGVMMAYVLYHNERFLINTADPIWNHYRPFKWWLLPHGMAGACALLLGPMQFSDRLRLRFTRLHRVVGRFYVFGALIAAPLGFYIQYFQERFSAPRSFTVLGAVDAALWMTTTGVAFWFALRRKIPQHRQWMTRSYAVALVFLEGRVILGVTGWERLGEPIVEAVIWACLVAAVPLADLALQWQDFRRSRPLPAKVGATAA